MDKVWLVTGSASGLGPEHWRGCVRIGRSTSRHSVYAATFHVWDV